MNFHKIKKDDCLNGMGVRVSLFVSGCDFRCDGCQNSQAWNINSGEIFTNDDMQYILKELSYDYVQGLTLLGGEPLHENNLSTVENIIDIVKSTMDNKDIWIYSGYTWEEICKNDTLKRIVCKCDVLVDGRFIKELKDEQYHWAGSTNQRVINIKKTLENGKVILL